MLDGRHRIVAMAGAALLAVPLTTIPVMVATAAPALASGGVLSGTASPSWQTNATVWSMAYANGAIYAAGDFSSVRAAGAAPGDTSETARSNLAAFDAASGNLLVPLRRVISPTPIRRLYPAPWTGLAWHAGLERIKIMPSNLGRPLT